MNKLVYFILLIGSCSVSFAQIDTLKKTDDKISAVTVGVFQGGGSIVGADIESMVYKNISFQIGFGFFAAGGGLNFHLKPTIRSSFISVGYWHQGFGDNFSQSMVGSTFVYRAKKLFTAQLGVGQLIETSEKMEKFYKNNPPPVLLLYSIGIYFPI